MKLVSLSQIPAEGVSHNREITKKVMLRRGDLPHLTNFSQSRFAPGQVAVGHAHTDMCEVFFVESGEGTIRIDRNVFPLQAGTCIAVEPGEVHEIVNSGDRELVLTYFGIEITPS